MAGPFCRLTGVDGEVWPFGDPSCPVRLWYVKGLEGADFEFDDTTGAGQAGVSFVARDDKSTIVGLGANIGPVEAGDFAVNLLRAWHRTLGRGTSQQPKGPLAKFEVLDTERYVMVRLNSKVPAQYEQMANVGWVREEIELRSDESWWRTDPVVRQFTAAQFPYASVPTKGTVPSWPHFRLYGPITLPKLGIGGEQIALPTIGIGDYLDIETDPNWFAVTNAAGQNRAAIGDRWHNQTPAVFDESGVEVPIYITGTNTNTSTRLVVTFPQLFESAL